MPDYLREALDQFEFTRATRRDLHRHPELGFEEVRTAGIIAAELNRLGMEVTTGVAKTGVVGLLEGSQPGPVVLLRFDMDGLPVTEETGADYASETPGKMHACGHDGHVAVGLTAARLLAAHRGELPGSIKFVFQPAEEGLGGAESMLEGGILENPKPDASLALHLWNDLPLGQIGIPAGPLMAGGEIFHVTVTGKGGHGGLPHLTADPVLAAAQIITALQGVVARNVSPLDSAVLSVTRIQGGETFNVIPPKVEFWGTIRSFEERVRQVVIERLRETALRTAEGMGCRAEVEVHWLTPAVINDPVVARVVQQAAANTLPDSQVDPNYRTMVSEDMAYIMQQVPGCYFMVGTANPEKGLDASHHHPKFDFDEEALPRAAALISAAAVALLEQGVRRGER